MASLSMVSATGYYQFKINHLETKKMGICEWIESPKFRVGQNDWSILYYPKGYSVEHNFNYASVFLKLHRESIDVTATFGFVMLNKHGSISWGTLRRSSQTFNSYSPNCGFKNFIDKAKLEEMYYVTDECFVLSVSIATNNGSSIVHLPPYTLTQPLQQLLNPGNTSHASSLFFPHERVRKFREENKQTEITFDVDGEKFVAHKLILAAHSPVFEAELFGSMAESNMKCITIKEMKPSVFKAMLDFMYNGSLMVNDEIIHSDDPMYLIQNLFVAADRYAVEQVKDICVRILVENISLGNVLSLLEFAEKHNCSQLKKHCLKFVVDTENSLSLMFDEEYIKLMQNYPSLLVALKEMTRQ